MPRRAGRSRIDEQVGELDVEGIADSGEELTRRLFLPAFDLRQVAQGDPGGRGDLTERAALLGRA